MDAVLCPRASWLEGVVAESFNPYRDWLGFASGQRPATHYDWFGLNPLESDAEKIHRAIAQLLAKVRGIRPGNRTPAWREIIEEISIAKACLTDPAAKAAYDAQLHGAAGAASRDAAVAPRPASPQAKGAAPRAATGKTGAPVTQAAQTGSSPHPPPPVPLERPAAPANQPTATFPPAAIPVPLSVPPSSPQPSAGQPPPAPIPLQGRTAPLPVDPSQVGQARPAQPGVAVYPPEYAPAPDAYPAPATVPLVRVTKPNARLRRRKTSLARRTIQWLLSLLVLLAIVIGFFQYQRHLNDRSLARVRPPEPKAVTKRLPAPDPAVTAAEELRRKKAGMQQNLTDLVAALAARDLPAAEALVAQARANASSPDDQKTVDKYEKLSKNVGEFWRIIADRVSKFRPQEEVALGKTRIFVVEVQDGRFSFKYGRKIFNSTIETMPSWLVIALADSDLTSDGPSKELYGAFLAVDPEGDRARARALWSEAASAGITIDESLPSLDSLPAAQEQ